MPGQEKARVLLVDDAPANIKILGSGLREDYSVRFATNGVDALRIAASEEPPDLILLDVLMPGMDGYTVCARLKSDPITERIPIIFITAKDEVEDEMRGLELGAVDYITKPFSLAIVKARVHTHLELKRHRDHLELLSSLDGLTSISNRRRFEQELDLEWHRAMRGQEPLSVAMTDIDHFKAFNDTYGHLVGDDCIKRVASELVACMEKHKGLVARYGGEEFSVIMPQADRGRAVELGEVMRTHVELLRMPHDGCPHCGTIHLSVGVATVVPRSNLRAKELVELADRALYAAKRAGRNRVVGSPEQ